MAMKPFISAGTPVFAILVYAALICGGPGTLRAQTATPDREAVVIEKSSGAVAGQEKSSGTVAPQKEPAFQGLIPPAGNIVTYDASAKPNGEDTHPAIRITPDKSELVRLEKDASSIIVGNPDHLGVLMDNRRLLILVPRAPGATYMTVLDSSGNVIMQRHVIVASPKSDYIRIRRSCAGQGNECQETSVYYCPGMCHPVGLVTSKGSGALAPIPSSGPVSNDNAEPDTGPVVDEAPAQETAAPVEAEPPVPEE